ncbi:MAG: FHA domain-containing protein [Pyrinomonadaceae bacterium]
MTKCDRCGTENLDGSQYCDECGASLEVGQSTHAQMSYTMGGNNAGGGGGANGDSKSVSDAPAARKPEFAPQHAAPAFAISSSALPVSDNENAHARLVIERGRSAGKQFPLSDEESQIGRWDADGGIFPDVDLDADDPEAKVSRRHARIMRRGELYFIEDLGSTNGTFINRGRRLLPGDRQPLRDGDEIIVGKTFLRFHVVK